MRSSVRCVCVCGARSPAPGTKMASEAAASGEQPPPPVRALATAASGGVDTKCEFNMDNLSKPELLTLLSIMEGELEARDLVIETLRARRKEVFLQERYGHYSLSDPFLALQRDVECAAPGGDKDRRGPPASSPISVLEAVMAHCRKMQERMSAQLAAAEGRQKRLEMEKLQLQSLEQEHRKLTAQLKDEREKNKHIVMMLVRECKQLATRVVEESQRFDELQARLDEESRTSGRLQEDLTTERQRGQQMEAKMEKQLSELDTEREQLRARLGREETESLGLRRQLEQLRTEQADGKVDAATVSQPGAAPTGSTAAKPKVQTSVAVATEPISSRTACCQTDLPPTEVEGTKKAPLSIPVKPAPANYAGLSLPKSAGRGIVHSSSGGLPQTENGSEAQTPHVLPSGVSPRVQAARYKFQEQDQNGTASQSPPARDLSPTNRDNFAAKQQARHTVTQVLSRFTSPPAGSAGPLRPGLPHSASEGGPFPGRLSHPIGLKSPTVARIDRGNPPPIPPKKPGLSQTPSPPHPPIKVVGDGSRSPGAGLKPVTPQLPPKPALDLVPALTSSQVGACLPSASMRAGRGPQPQPQQVSACAECPPVICPPAASTVSSPSIDPPSSSASAPCSRSPRAPAGSPLATASGWRPSIVSCQSAGGPADLDGGCPLILQAASQGNVTLLSMLLNRPDQTTTDAHTTVTAHTNTSTGPSSDAPTDTSTPAKHELRHLDPDARLLRQRHRSSALAAAAQNGHTDCVNLLLISGVSADVLDDNGFTPLHLAAKLGSCSCAEALLDAGADVNHEAPGGQSPLYLASGAGSPGCVWLLLNAGAERSRTTADGCTVLHAAVRSGHVETLRLLLYHSAPGDPSVTPDPGRLALPAALLNQANVDGWTAAHMAAASGLKECLEVLCSHAEQNIERRDKCNRTIHDVATDDCKDLLENLDCYRVQVSLQSSSAGSSPAGGLSPEPLCPLQGDGEAGAGDLVVLGRLSVDRATSWDQLGRSLGQALSAHLQLLCQDSLQAREDTQRPPLGLGPDCISSVLIGDTVWLPGQELTASPWDLVRKPLSQRITIRLQGLSELALESLLPLPLLNDYIRLVEQYGSLFFHGLEGSCQEYIASQIARCVKSEQEAGGVACDVIRVEVDESLTKEQLLETFIHCGFLVPAAGSEVARVGGGSVVLLLEGLEKASSLVGLLGELCHGLDNRGSACLALPTGPHYFREGGFLIGTLSKPRLQSCELHLQQHFRWATLRWEQEPLHGLLGRHLRRKLLHKTGTGLWAPEGPMERSVVWVSEVWQRLNSCLSRLGCHEALLGPRLFLSCPIVPGNTQAIVRWMSRLWNAVVVPRVQEAIVARVTANRPSPLSPRRPSPSNLNTLSCGQQAVVKAALSILINKAVILGCPLPRHEIDRYLLEFRGGGFPISALGASTGNGGSGGGRKGRDSGAWPRARTSPRKKGSSASSWSSGGSFREGSRSNTDVSLVANGHAQRVSAGQPVGMCVFSDDETDLIRELHTMCCSKSEPDISKMAQTREDVIVLSPSEAPPPRRKPQDAGPQPRQQPQSGAGPASHGPQRSAPRPKSQLPVPSSRGQQSQAPRAAGAATGYAGSGAGRTQASLSRSSKPRPGGNNHCNNVNNNSSQQQDIWILHRDLHDNHKK